MTPRVHSPMESPDYLSRAPESVPSGKIVVHNDVRPTKRFGSRGFQFDFLGYTFRPRMSTNRWGKTFVNFSPGISSAWLAEPSPQYEVCPCEWAPELGAHYRVRRPAYRSRI